MLRQPATSTLILCLLIGTSAGCTTLKAPKFPWQKSDEIEYKVPQKMVVTWKDTVRSHPTDPPTRGFGGRVHFYDESNAPCRVQGEFVVYGFIDTPEFQVDRDKPERKYVFAAEDLDSHYSVSKIGDSYSFWIPWDNPGGPQLEITLAPFFRGTGGKMVVGDQSRNVLPGVTIPKRENPQTENLPTPIPPSGVYPVGYQQEQANLDRSARMKTTTIPLNHSMTERLRNTSQTQNINPEYPTQIQPPSNPSSSPSPVPHFNQGAYPSASHHSQHSVPGNRVQQSGVPSYGEKPNPGGMPSEYYVTPGINLQSYKPAFSNSGEYSRFLSTGHATAFAPHVPAVGYPPGSLQVPATQNAPPSAAGPRTQQSPSLWPPGLPQPQIHQGSTAIQPAAATMNSPSMR